ncbi:MAG: pseudouridine synthase [Holophagaceae bacterium]|nr:pseudouridine synthase [Holophagaceae bacterium]
MDEATSRARQASRITVPRLDSPPATVLDFLRGHFNRIQDWASRVDRGLVRLEGGETVTASTPCRPGLVIEYFREVAEEAAIPGEVRILHRDAHLLVADKPAFLPVVPAGGYVKETLLARLQAETGRADLVPLHRLDRETAGLVLFSVEPATRAAYAGLFAGEGIVKTYEAVAEAPTKPAQTEWRVENRLGEGEPFFRMAIVEGPPNARSLIRLLDWKDGRGRFEIKPATGKKHQIRLHMLAIGYPILHDRFYPELQPEGPPDYERPLQLLAKRLEFVDPVSGEARRFDSERALQS